MGTYRVEEASSARAGCKNKECQEKKVKILKGELRFGTWVEMPAFQSWHWRHWGCVTPKQVKNLIDGIEGDCSVLDGYDEISSENQEKVQEAVKEGHVADSDWNGDVEVNRPGKMGFRVPASKKAKPEAKSDEEEEKPQKKKRAKGKKEVEASDVEDAEHSPKQTKTSSKKRKSVKSVADADNIPDEQPKSESKSSARGKKRKATDVESSKEDLGESADDEPKPATNKRKANRKASKIAADNPEQGEADNGGGKDNETAPRRSKRRTSSRKKFD